MPVSSNAPIQSGTTTAMATSATGATTMQGMGSRASATPAT